MNNEILSVQECQGVIEELDIIRSELNKFIEDFEECINLINSNEIVQSFYASGTLGKEKEAQMKLIHDAVEKYKNIIDNGDVTLIPKTLSVMQKQIQMLNSHSMSNGVAGEPVRMEAQ